jgi:hypothetical protein
MFKLSLFLALAGFAAGASGEQFEFDWGLDTPGQCPPGFVSLVSGTGPPADWTVQEELVPPVLAALTSNGRENVAKRSVLGVQSPDLGEEHCPILLFTNEIFSDFTLTTRFKIAGGIIDPMAGVIFRAQDASNYYVVRASTEGNLLWYRVVGGKAYEMLGIGVRLPMPKDTWRELRIECKGSGTRCFLDGKLVIPPAKPGAPTDNLAINDTTFRSGKLGFWAKADTRCYFVDSAVDYTEKVPFVEVAMGEVARKFHPLELAVYADKTPKAPVVVATMNAQEMGTAGTKYDQDVIDRGSIYYLKLKGAVEVTLPLRDRNGEVAAALRVRMKSFPGEMQTTAVERATVIKNAMETQLNTLQNIME